MQTIRELQLGLNSLVFAESFDGLGGQIDRPHATCLRFTERWYAIDEPQKLALDPH